LPDLYDGPMPGQRQGSRSIRHRPAHDEVVVAAHQDADHEVSGPEPRIGNGAADGEVVDDLAREFARILVRQRIVHFLLELFRICRMLFAGFGNHGSELARVSILRSRARSR
jgi:hypothetical protein